MSEFFRTAIGPALALMGTLVVAFLGYRQWRKQQDVARYGDFLIERQAAYKDLWQKLEAVHLHVRSHAFDEEKFRMLVRAANSHLIKAGLYLDTGEKKRANDYLAALGNLGKLLSEGAATDAKTEVRQSLYDTAEIPPQVLARVKGLDKAYAAVEEKREFLIAHFREVLGAKLFP
jgi:hypothetical protein